MNVRARRQKAIAEINITPFTDVILVLLIIFMITTPLMLQAGIKVNLPDAASAKSGGSGSQVRITLSSRNSIYLDDRAVTKKELKEKISAMRANNPGLEVVLLSDKFAQFKDVVAVLDILNAGGVKHLNIGTKTENPERMK